MLWFRQMAVAANTGVNKVFGSISKPGTPAEAVASAVVNLFADEIIPTAIALQNTNANGEFEFLAISHRSGDGGYIVFAKDPSDTYDPVCKSALIPTPMAPDPSEHE